MNRPNVNPLVFCALFASLAVNAFADDKNMPPGEKPKNPDRVYVKMETSMGPITLELNAEKAPLTVANFLTYTDEGFYKDTIFHRVMDGFMIQGGGFDKDMTQKSVKAGVKNEWKNGLKNKRGTISMARLGRQPDSATSQFFINVVDNAMLDQPNDGAAYAVFGKVIDGIDVVDRIKKVKTTTKGQHQNVPEELVMIKDVVRVPADQIPADIMAKAKAAAVEETKQAEEDAKKAADALTKVWDEAMDIVKSRGGDTTKGVKTAKGVWFVDLSVGSGASPVPTDKITAHYTGWLTDGTKTKFDSSVGKQPLNYSLTGLVGGWADGLATAKVGGKRILVIPPELAYGAAGRPGIPPNATLVFEIEILGLNQ